MCGIAGYFERGEKAGEADPKILRNMADAMKLRGPDDSGIVVFGPVGLAHSRLAVIDRIGGKQPFSNASGSLQMVYNGEIFNFRELRAGLEAAGHSFLTNSDTEVLLAMYAEHGPAMLEKLNGFFAFAILDRENRKLFLARDRFGVKPLFYHVTDQTFAFASELAALKQLPTFDENAIRMDSVTDFLALQYVPNPKTIYSHTFKLEPGRSLTFDLNTDSFITERWFTPVFRQEKISYSDACVELRARLKRAVERRLIADVPLGVFLSGGMDSAVIAALAAGLSHEPLHAFTIAFRDSKYDESELAKESADIIRLASGNPFPHSLKIVDPCDFDLLRELSVRFGEPYADASMLPTAMLCRFARSEGMVTALSGDGADELFYGYDRYRAARFFRLASWLPPALLRLLARSLPAGNERTFSGRLKRFLLAAAMPSNERYCDIITHHAAERLSALLAVPPAERPFAKLFPVSAADPADAAARFDRMTYLPGDILVKSDTCSMAASLELRSPFLDSEVADFADSLPRHFKLTSSLRKRIVGHAFADLLPCDLAIRPKRGFGVPLADWLRGPWRESLRDLVLDKGLLPDEIFRRSALETMISAHKNGHADHGYMLFSLMMLALFFDGKK